MISYLISVCPARSTEINPLYASARSCAYRAATLTTWCGPSINSLVFSSINLLFSSLLAWHNVCCSSCRKFAFRRPLERYQNTDHRFDRLQFDLCWSATLHQLEEPELLSAHRSILMDWTCTSLCNSTINPCCTH